MWFGGGGKWPIFDIQLRPLLGDALLGWHLCPIDRERERERDPKPYPSKQERRTHGRTKWIRICYGMGRGREKKH